MHLPTQSGMEPCGIPPIARQMRSDTRAIHVGPPPSLTEQECGTVEALVGQINNYPAYADYWKPNEEQLAMLNAGGTIELIQYTNQMVMHSMSVWRNTDDAEG